MPAHQAMLDTNEMVLSLLTRPGIIDVILVFTLVEAAVLRLWHRRTGQGLPPSAVGAMLLPGVFLLLAVRAALAGAVWPWVPAALAASLAAHLADLRARWVR